MAVRGLWFGKSWLVWHYVHYVVDEEAGYFDFYWPVSLLQFCICICFVNTWLFSSFYASRRLHFLTVTFPCFDGMIITLL